MASARPLPPAPQGGGLAGRRGPITRPWWSWLSSRCTGWATTLSCSTDRLRRSRSGPNAEAARAVADRRTGCRLRPGHQYPEANDQSGRADVFMRIHNPDGSEVERLRQRHALRRAPCCHRRDRQDRNHRHRDRSAACCTPAPRANGRVTVDMGRAAHCDWDEIPAGTRDARYAASGIDPGARPARRCCRTRSASNMGNPARRVSSSTMPRRSILLTVGPHAGAASVVSRARQHRRSPRC